MNFFILGDSWGVGEWIKKNGKYESIPNTGLDYHLTQLGHTVTNISSGSAGNFGQLRHAYWTLKEKSDYDYIIWFHVEPVRDLYETVINDPVDGPKQYPTIDKKNFISCINYIHTQNYMYAQKIYDEFTIPFIVIGASGLVVDLINNFNFSKYIIKSWASELLDTTQNTPLNLNSNWILTTLDHYSNFDRQQVLTELEWSRSMEENMIANPSNFPDNAHPSSECFKQLAQRIIEMI